MKIHYPLVLVTRTRPRRMASRPRPASLVASLHEVKTLALPYAVAMGVSNPHALTVDELLAAMEAAVASASKARAARRASTRESAQTVP